jgi:hypothetical protein
MDSREKNWATFVRVLHSYLTHLSHHRGSTSATLALRTNAVAEYTDI